MNCQHVCATIPCRHGEGELMRWLDAQKNQMGCDLVSLSVVQVLAEAPAGAVEHVTAGELTERLVRAKNGRPASGQQVEPAWFVILRRELEPEEKGGPRPEDIIACQDKEIARLKALLDKYDPKHTADIRHPR